MKTTVMFALSWVAGVLLAAVLSAGVDPLDYAGSRSRDEEQRLRRNSSSLAAMLGEFRTSISDIMFIKTERYLHAGIGYRPHHDESALSAEELVADIEEHQRELGIHAHEHGEAAHADIPILIPPREDDFRGFIGWLHREVKPWRDPSKPHLHADGRELLPWFKVMTVSDPHYVRGYVAGGFWLQTENPATALAFIEEGIENNPEAFQLYVSRGFLRLREARGSRTVQASLADPDARALLKQARGDFYRGAELALDTRPANIEEIGFETADWGPYHENDAMAAANMTVLLTRELGEPGKARELAYRYLEIFPDFTPLRKVIQTP